MIKKIEIEIHKQEPICALISALCDLLNHQEFDILGEEGREKALRVFLMLGPEKI